MKICNECLAIGICSEEAQGEATSCELKTPMLDLKESSCFKEAQHFPNINELYVRFHSGVVFVYEGVKSCTIDDWKLASSSGSFFSRNIRNNFPCRKVGA